MNPKLLLVLIALCLPACATRSVQDDLPASDLDALEANVTRTLAPRTLPNGKTYCAELAATERQQDACMGDLEATLWESEQDKANGLDLIQRAIKRLRIVRNPCGFWARLFRNDRCEVQP